MTIQRFKTITAVHLFLLRNKQVLLLRRFQTGYEDGKYSVIAGHIDGNEEIKVAMSREAREEVGIHIEPKDLTVIGVIHRKALEERIDFFLVAKKWEGEIINAEPHKCDELAWFDLDALPENIIPYVRRALENYKQDIWFDSVGWD
jgi:ADP-ribose pyrophosphatase YjhB (NUDIX family)